ncbi:histidine phosphatase family protein [soil metagenome]
MSAGKPADAMAPTSTSPPTRISSRSIAPDRSLPGTITLCRHGEPALSREVTLNAGGYRDWWARYEEGGIRVGHSPPLSLLELARGAKVIFSSTRRRAQESAEAVTAGREFVRDPVFIEAPLPPPHLPGVFRVGPRVWGFLARLVWWFGHAEGQETRRQAQARAKAAADRLEGAAQTEGDVLLLAHGFFNHMIGAELKRRGWRMIENRGYRYWSVRRFSKR